MRRNGTQKDSEEVSGAGEDETNKPKYKRNQKHPLSINTSTGQSKSPRIKQVGGASKTLGDTGF